MSRKRRGKKGKDKSKDVSIYNNEHYTDFTAFNAMTGKELISKSNVTNLGKRVNGSYNE